MKRQKTYKDRHVALGLCRHCPRKVNRFSLCVRCRQVKAASERKRLARILQRAA